MALSKQANPDLEIDTVSLHDFLEEEKQFVTHEKEKADKVFAMNATTRLKEEDYSDENIQVILNAITSGEAVVSNANVDEDTVEDLRKDYREQTAEFTHSLLFLTAPLDGKDTLTLSNFSITLQKKCDDICDGMETLSLQGREGVDKVTITPPDKTSETLGFSACEEKLRQEVAKKISLQDFQRFDNFPGLHDLQKSPEQQPQSDIKQRLRSFSSTYKEVRKQKLDMGGELTFSVERNELSTLQKEVIEIKDVSYKIPYVVDKWRRTLECTSVTDIYPNRVTKSFMPCVVPVTSLKDIQNAIKEFAFFAMRSLKSLIIFNGHGSPGYIYLRDEDNPVPSSKFIKEARKLERYVISDSNPMGFPNEISIVGAQCYSHCHDYELMGTKSTYTALATEKEPETKSLMQLQITSLNIFTTEGEDEQVRISKCKHVQLRHFAKDQAKKETPQKDEKSSSSGPMMDTSGGAEMMTQ